MDYSKMSLELHRKAKGKIEVVSRVRVKDREDLSLAYTPGVAAPCLEIAEDETLSYVYTRRGNLVAVITDGTAVLGLGDIGPSAGMPVMEGKCVLFKEFGNVDAFPLCVNTKDPDEFVGTVYNISKSFGGINLEDISAPRCFEIERRLKELCDIPVFHDDQHGTAVVVAAAIINSCRLTGKKLSELKLVLVGLGAAGCSITKLLISLGVGDIVLCDKNGAISRDTPDLSPHHRELAEVTNRENFAGSLREAVRGRDVFIGVSAPNLLTAEDIAAMNKNPFVFAMANPNPEIHPEEAKKGGAYIIGTGRSDYPNQINNVLAFPGIFRGALDVRASDINDEMKIAAAKAIASLVSDSELSAEYILPHAFDKRIGETVAAAVAEAARKSGVARI